VAQDYPERQQDSPPRPMRLSSPHKVGRLLNGSTFSC
jgi:hypothetical protein